MKVRAVGLILVLLLGLEFLVPDSRSSIAGSSVVAVDQLTFPDALFPEAISPFCSDPEEGVARLRDERPVHLAVTVNDQRGWVTNAFEAWLSLAEFGGITDSFKNGYDATIVLTYEDGDRCVDRARVRLHGDWIDHLRPMPEGIQASLDVRLQTGHLAGVVDFKLLLPETRYGDNEVFATALFDELGFLTPRTFYVDATVNGVEVRYLFQEKFREELLERRKIPEAPIFQGDERFGFVWTSHEDPDDVRDNPHVFSTGRLSNPQYVENGPVALTIAEEGLSRLNQAFAQIAVVVPGAVRRVSLPLTGDGFTVSQILTDVATPVLGGTGGTTSTEAARFTALFLAIGDEGSGFVHGLQSHNQRFVYDPWLGTVRPIYYDGQVTVLKRDVQHQVRLREWFKDLVGISSGEIAVTDAAARAASMLQGELALIELAPLHMSLVERGAVVTKEEIRDIIGRGGIIDRNLGLIASSGGLLSPDRVPAALFADFSDPSVRLVFGSLPAGSYLVCEVGADECANLELSPDEQVSLLRGALVIEGVDYLYVGNSQSDYQEGLLQPDRLAGGWEHRPLSGFSTLSTNESVEVLLDTGGRHLELNTKGPGPRAVIWNGELDGWTINITGLPATVSASSADTEKNDFRGLSGCLTFRDIELSDLKIRSIGGECEDSVHFLRVDGHVSQIDVEGAHADAVDMDFSNLNVSVLEVIGAGNDCLDLSAGDYSFDMSRLISCADKGVSIGEAARGKFETLFIGSAGVGIVSKDSSTATVRWANLDEVGVCASVYRKKQAYWGGSLVLETISCDSGDYRKQDGSMLRIDNR